MFSGDTGFGWQEHTACTAGAAIEGVSLGEHEMGLDGGKPPSRRKR